MDILQWDHYDSIFKSLNERPKLSIVPNMPHRLLRQLQIRQRLWLLVALAMTGFVLVTAATVNYSSRQFILMQKQNTQTQVEGARKVIEYFHNRVQQGELSRADGKHQALKAIEALRPDERTYFYIYHASNFIVMHPFLKNQTYPDEPPEIVQVSHKKFIDQLNKNAKTHNLLSRTLTPVDWFNQDLPGQQSGFFEYLYFVDGNNIGGTAKLGDPQAPSDAERKMAYGSRFAPWDWVIFGGVFLGDLDEIFRGLVIELVVPVLFGAVIVTLMALIISNSITQPLRDTVKTIESLASNEHFDQELDDSSHDEISVLARSFNALLTHIRGQSSLLREKNQDLEQHREHLEIQIESRTHNLAVATEQAQAASEAKSEFLATMSHELRTPLNGILGVLTLLQDSEMSDSVRKSLAVVESSGQQLLSIVNDILNFEKLDSGNVAIESISFSPHKLFQQASSAFEFEVAQKGIDLAVYLDETVPVFCVGDPLRIKQIFNNLVSNAVKFTHEGEVRVTMSWEKTKEEFHIRVKDTGIGIPAERINSIFRSFEQADSTTTRRYGGTGLGLGISKKLVELMQGQVSVTSEAGTGSCFTVSLPLAETTDEPQIDHNLETEALYINASKLSVLVAEDNAVNQLVVKGFLKKFNISPDIVDNGDSAQKAIISRPKHYDLVLMDISMPKMDGYEATRHIREALGESEKPAIYALSANVLADHVRKAKACGMNGTIMKPLDINLLRGVLEQQLQL